MQFGHWPWLRCELLMLLTLNRIVWFKCHFTKSHRAKRKFQARLFQMPRVKTFFNVQKHALKFNARFYALSTNFNIFANPSFASYRLFSTICLSQKWPFCLPAFSLASLSPILEIVFGRYEVLKHPFLLPQTKEITDKR